MENKKFLGVIIFAGLLLSGSVYKFLGLLNFPYYAFMFQQLSPDVIRLRYAASLVLRLVGLCVGVGILYYKEPFRKAGIGLCLLTLCTLYWKHPYSVFENIAVQQEAVLFPEGGKGLEFEREGHRRLVHPWFPLISMGFYYLVDIVFASSFIYYFTRPQVKRQFQ